MDMKAVMDVSENPPPPLKRRAEGPSDGMRSARSSFSIEDEKGTASQQAFKQENGTIEAESTNNALVG